MYVQVLPWCLHSSSFGKFSRNVRVKLVEIDNVVHEWQAGIYGE